MIVFFHGGTDGGTDGDMRLMSLMPIIAIILTVLGLYVGFSEMLMSLVLMWRTDELRSIGLLMPLAALFFAVQKKEQLDWNAGSWWGLVLIVVLVALRYLSGDRAVFSILYGEQLIAFAPLSVGMTLMLYFTGAVLFFCGARGVRLLRFPLFLLLFVNPVPGFFASLDLPLQTIGAIVARWFAGVMSVPVEPGLLKLMFAPHLGMFIAPGCDGLLGVSTMLCLSLIVGHYYRMRPAYHGMFVLLSMALAYGLNLVRLCCVVVYYRIALKVDAIAPWGAEIDYVIGGILFFMAALFVFGYPRREAAA